MIHIGFVIALVKMFGFFPHQNWRLIRIHHFFYIIPLQFPIDCCHYLTLFVFHFSFPIIMCSSNVLVISQLLLSSMFMPLPSNQWNSIRSECFVAKHCESNWLRKQQIKWYKICCWCGLFRDRCPKMLYSTQIYMKCGNANERFCINYDSNIIQLIDKLVYPIDFR